jgi:hypothetical protein
MSTNPHPRKGRGRLKTASLLLLSLMILAAAASVGRGLPGELIDRFSERGAMATLTDLTGVNQLQSAFNRADGTPRLILLFSPT